MDGTEPIKLDIIVASVRAYLKSPDTPTAGDRPVLATYVALAVGLTLMMGGGGALDEIRGQ